VPHDPGGPFDTEEHALGVEAEDIVSSSSDSVGPTGPTGPTGPSGGPVGPTGATGDQGSCWYIPPGKRLGVSRKIAISS